MQLSGKNIGFGVLILLGFILALAPLDAVNKKGLSAEKVMIQMQNGNYYVQAEELAHLIIDKDPSIQLIDVRSAADYEKYHIPGNLHIPLSELANKENLEMLDKDKTIILASNGNTRAAQAWVILEQLGFEDVFVLAGGVNHWVDIFTNPQKPAAPYTDDEIFRYQFRKAAGAQMLGASVAQAYEKSSTTAKPKVLKRKRKKAVKKVDEGC